MLIRERSAAHKITKVLAGRSDGNPHPLIVLLTGTYSICVRVSSQFINRGACAIPSGARRTAAICFVLIVISVVY
jgi:hypothetical protein